MFSAKKQRDFPNHRGGRAISVPAAVILLAFAMLIGGCDPDREVLTRVDSEKEANRILVELESRGVKQAQIVETTEQRKAVWSISVLPGDLPAARKILVESDLPREKHAGFASMAESSSLIPSKSEERAKMISALSGELERTFETYDRVVSARVHIVLPERDLLMRETTTRPSASAMVLIKYTPSGDAPPTSPKAANADVPVTQEEVQQMVARSIEGLVPANVYVTYTRAAEREDPVVKAASGTDATASGGQQGSDSRTSGASDRDPRLLQMFIGVVCLGLMVIVLIFMLFREKRRKRAPAPAVPVTQKAAGAPLA